MIRIAAYLVLAVPISLLLASHARAQGALSPHDRGFKARVGGIFMNLDSEVSVDSRTLRGTKLGLEDDLGLAGQPVFPFVEIGLGNIFRLNLGFLQSTRLGDERLSRQVAFNGHVMGAAMDTLDTRAELLTADFSISSAFYRNSGIQLEFIAGGKYVHLKHRITTDNLSGLADTDSTTDTVDVPAFYYGLGGHLLLDQTLTLYSTFLFTQYAWKAFDTARFFYTDFVIGLTYVLLPRISLSVDYRLLRLEITEDNSGSRSNYELFGNGVGVSALWAF